MTQHGSAKEEMSFRDVAEWGLERQTRDSKARGHEKRHQSRALGIRLLLFLKKINQAINKSHTLQLPDVFLNSLLASMFSSSHFSPGDLLKSGLVTGEKQRVLAQCHDSP